MRRKATEEVFVDGEAPPRKYAKKEGPTAESDDADSVLVCELSAKRRVSVRNWKGVTVVDIREFYEKDGKQLPGKKGISLSVDQWKILHEHVDAIDKAVAEKS